MDFLDDFFQPFTNAIQAPGVLMLTIFIMYAAIKLMYGKTEHASSLLSALIIATIVVPIYTSYSVYKYWIIDTFLSFSLGSASFFLGEYSTANNISALFGSINDAYSLLFAKLEYVLSETSWTDSVSNYFMVGLISAVFGWLYFKYTVQMIGAVFGMVMLFVLGGLPLFLSIIPSTRFVFWAWFRALFNYALIPVFASMVMAISFKFLDKVIFDFTQIDYDDLGVFSKQTGLVLLGASIAAYLLQKSEDLAATLTGGSPGNLSSPAGAAGAAAVQGIRGLVSNKLTNKLTDKATSWAGGKISSGIGNLYSKMKGY